MKNLYLFSAFLTLLTFAPQLEAKTLEELLVEKGVISKEEASATTETERSKIYWDKGTKIEFPDAGLNTRISILMQQRYIFKDKDAGRADTSSFEIPRARLILAGSALHKEFDYYIQTEFTGSSGSRLRDASLTWNASDWSSIRMGQYKPSFGRQFRNSDAELQFFETSSVTDFFAPGRQSGISSSIFDEDKNLIATAGIFNGLSDEEGINNPGIDTKHSGFVEIRYNALGQINAFNEGDLEYSDDLGLSMGLAYGVQDNRNDLGNGLEKVQSNNVAADINLKYQGLSSQTEYFVSSVDTDSEQDNIDPQGFYTQLGYFIVPKKLEIAARYGLIDCDNGRAIGVACENADKVNEAGISFNYFFWKHHLKAQFGYFLVKKYGLSEEDEDLSDNKWVFQLTSAF